MFEYCEEALCANVQPCPLHQSFSTQNSVNTASSTGKTNLSAPNILRIPKGTPFTQDKSDSRSSTLSVLSYNLLAPIYVRPIDARTGEVQDFAGFPWASEADLDWETRREKLRNEIVNSCADVICLQEVQFVRKASSPKSSATATYELPSFLRLKGYHVLVPTQYELQNMADRNLRVLRAVDSPVGNALLVNTKRLEVMEQDPHNTRCLNVCVRGKGSLSHLHPTVISCLHLDASSEEKRAQQVRICCERIKSRFRVRDIILAGDFNTECEPGTALSRFCYGEPAPTRVQLIEQWKTDARVLREPTSDEEKKWSALHDEALSSVDALRLNFARAPLGPTRAGFNHTANAPPCISWQLDHIWVSSRRLTISSVWETLEADEASTRLGLPNKTCPSDHLPVLATFAVSHDELLSEEAKASLLSRLDTHRRSCQALEAQMEVAKSDTTEVKTSNNDEQKSEKVVKPPKKAKPSPEEIALLQAQRAKKKELIKSLENERTTFWTSLSELERDVVEDLGFDRLTV